MKPLALAALALLVTGCAAGPAATPHATGPSHEPAFGLDPSRIPVGTATSDMAMARGDERRAIGTAVSSIERVTLGGRPVLRFVLTQQLGSGTMTDTLDADAGTLQPLRYRNVFGERQSIRVDYGADGHVVSTLVRDGVRATLDTTLVGPHFDAAQFQPLIAALPLRDGYTAEIPVFHYENGAGTVAVRVVGRDTVERAGGARPVWLVEYEAAPGQLVNLSIDRETGRAWRATAALGGGQRYEEVAR